MTETSDARFTLDVDPEQIREAARSMRGVAEEFALRGEKITRTADGVAGRWTGGAAKATLQEMRGLGGHLESFAEGADDTRTALRRLARQYETALAEVDRLNEEWRTAEAVYLTALRTAFSTPGVLPRKAPSGAGETQVDWAALAAQSAEASAQLKRAAETWTAEQARLTRAFAAVEEQAREDTRTCAKAISTEAPFVLVPLAAAAYRRDGYVGLGSAREDFTRTLPLSRYVVQLEAVDVGDGEDPLGPWITERDVFGGQAFWAEKQGKQYLEALKDAGDYAGDVDEAAFVRSMRFLGTGLTVGFAIHDIKNGASPTETVTTTAVGAGAFALGAGAVVLAVPAAPVLVVGGAAVAAGAAATYGTTKLLRTKRIKNAVEYTDGELRFMGQQLRKRWNDIF